MNTIEQVGGGCDFRKKKQRGMLLNYKHHYGFLFKLTQNLQDIGISSLEIRVLTCNSSRNY